ncbi:MAG TPA: helix-turn-helix transcriptional regulator [Mycobacteriales bacterium]|nr:helix-turn-helix transcriptional regulator [Mycobacteriales bacterium]
MSTTIESSADLIDPFPTVTTGSDTQPAAELEALRRRELAAFLRSRRERLSPDQLELPSHGRRRTPGLRREEVAQHAGVGVTWYTWLEQARDIHVSEQVLDAIARTLLLDPHERSHLFTLAGSPLTVTGPDSMPLSEPVRTLLAKLDPYPTCVTNGRYDLLAYNRAYTVLMGDLDSLPFQDRNSMWLLFTNREFRDPVPDWECVARRLVAQYRAAMAEHVGEPVWKCLVRRLQDASPEFAEMWRRHDVAAPENVTKRLRHPQLGALQFSSTNLWLSQRLGVRLLTYTPDDAETLAALTRAADVEPRSLLEAG